MSADQIRAENGVDHGGDLEAARQRFGEPAGGWLDLSTGINPHAYPLPPLPPEAWSRLPQPDAEAALREAARGCYGAPDGAHIVAAPGTQALIQALPRLRQPAATVAVIGPTYGEHAHVWRAAGHEVREVPAPDQVGEASVAVLVNPNNPDGRIVPRGAVLALADNLTARGGLLVVDEAFADTDPAVSVADRAGRKGLLVLRSFGKFYGLAGLRLGFALADKPMAGALEDSFGPWPVSGPALEIGRRALADTAWSAAMRERLAGEARALDGVLVEGGLRVVGGTSLFRLVECADAAALHERLARRGILVRIFTDRPALARIGLPGAVANIDRLAAALAAVKS